MWADCMQCGHPVDDTDPQPCEDGGVCHSIPEDPHLAELWAENDGRLSG